MKLHLGIIEQMYQDGHETTGDVATILENKYAVMGGYVELHEQDIADAMADSVAGALQNMLNGAPPTNDVFGQAMNDIKVGFDKYLIEEQISSLGRKGVPTQAALDGKSKRFKYKKGPRRPSFIDTGLYETSFIAWVD